MSASRVTRLAVLLGVVAVGLDALLTGRLGLLFDLCFVSVCVAAALAVRPGDFFPVGVLPPLLLLGLVALLAVLHPAYVALPGDGVIQAVVSGLAHHATALMVGYVLVLGVLGMRQHVLGMRAASGPSGATHPGRAHSNRVGSPAPTRTTSGTSSE